MMKSHVFIVATSHNDDGNTIAEIADAVAMCGADDMEVSDDGIIQATIPSHEISLVQLFDGVSYIRADQSFLAS